MYVLPRKKKRVLLSCITLRQVNREYLFSRLPLQSEHIIQEFFLLSTRSLDNKCIKNETQMLLRLRDFHFCINDVCGTCADP